MQNKSSSDFFVDNSPLNNIRLRMWERNFPGIGDQLGEIFNTQMPSPKEIGEWKMTWYQSTPYQMPIQCQITPTSMVSFTASGMPQSGNAAVLPMTSIKEEIFQLTKSLGIHPYFWEFWQVRHPSESNSFMDDKWGRAVIRVEPMISFFYEEHHVMFKLAW